ncbi:MAG: hypothetical protein ACRDDX_10655 [Cellulosilyticaceae bacterium]
MFEFNKSLRKMTDEEEDLILTAIYNINSKPHDAFTVYCDTSNPACVPFIATLVKRVQQSCRGITGCIIYSDKVVFGEDKIKKTTF